MELKSLSVISLATVLLVLPVQLPRSDALTANWVEMFNDEVGERDKLVDDLKNKFDLLARQLMLQQFFVEEKIRSDGNSGVKRIRIRRNGAKNYHSETHAGGSMTAIHDHSNNIRTVGMGEFIGVLNGVEFRTRHNDYRLFMPHRTSSQWHATEPIPFPDIPIEVQNQRSVPDQITEMREWFKAWATQNITHRDYRKYFKPILCYLEGAWTKSKKSVEEPFDSDRHFVDARTWQELQERVRFASYTGTKSRLENLAFLPTTLMEINGSHPVFAQWNYRILCNPLNRDLPLNRFRVVDDFSNRMMTRRTMPMHLKSKAARFVLNSKDSDQFYDRPLSYGLLDKLMETIPGKNNHQGYMKEQGVDGDDLVMNMDGKTIKDVSRYHRWFRMGKADAMGVQSVKRGYSDAAVFMAMTNQSNVAGLSIEDRKSCTMKNKKRVCKKISQKWSYAIPLEIIYLTPLSSWNPYGLPYFGDARKSNKIVAADGRNGDCRDKSGKRAYNGTNSKIYYLTPSEFFSGKEHQPDPADTSRGDTCILDQDGSFRKVRSSGVRIFIPEIKGVGVLRQRWPIMPIHGEGSSVWKELNAFTDALLNPKDYPGMLSEKTVEPPKPTTPPSINDLELVTKLSRSSAVSPHVHTLTLGKEQVEKLNKGQTVTVMTSHNNGHSHSMAIKYNRRRKVYFYRTCGGQKVCRDGHPRLLEKVSTDGNASA